MGVPGFVHATYVSLFLAAIDCWHPINAQRHLAAQEHIYGYTGEKDQHCASKEY